MKRMCLAVAALEGMALAGQAHAATMPITFSGGGVSGSLVITFGTATDMLYSNALEIAGVSGSFSDSNIGIANAAVTSLAPINNATPLDPENVGVAPNDFSQFAVASGLPTISGGFITYDKLMFGIGSGRVVDLFSNGVGNGEGMLCLASSSPLKTWRWILVFRVESRCRRRSPRHGP